MRIARLCLRIIATERACPTRRLNAHLTSIVSSQLSSFFAPVEATGRAAVAGARRTSRLSSFGFSGTIAHGCFCVLSEHADAIHCTGTASLFRDEARHAIGSSRKWAMTLVLVEQPSCPVGLVDAVASSFVGQLSLAAKVALSDHTISDRILLPGVGYVEMSMVHNPAHESALVAVAFIRPCVVPQLNNESAVGPCIFCYTGQSPGSFEVAS